MCRIHFSPFHNLPIYIIYNITLIRIIHPLPPSIRLFEFACRLPMNAAINRKANLLSNRSASFPSLFPPLPSTIADIKTWNRAFYSCLFEGKKIRKRKRTLIQEKWSLFPSPFERNFLESHRFRLDRYRGDFPYLGEKGERKKWNFTWNRGWRRFRWTPSRYRNHFRPTTGWLDFVPLILRAASYPGITMETGDAVSMENRRQRYTKPTRDHEISACRLPPGHEISFSGSIGRERGRRFERGERIERITETIVLILRSFEARQSSSSFSFSSFSFSSFLISRRREGDSTTP